MNKRIVKEEADAVKKELVGLIKPEDLREEKQDGKIVFTFSWLLKEPMRMHLDIEKRQIILSDILIDVPSDSGMYADILLLTREFNADREELLEFGLLNRDGVVSLICKVKHDYTYGTEKTIRLANEIFQKVFEDYPEYTKEKFNQIMIKVRIKDLEYAIPVVLIPYHENIEKERPYRSPGSWDLATLPNNEGEYHYQQGDFFIGGIAGVDNVRLPVLGFRDWHDQHYRIAYPVYKDLRKEGNVTYHTLFGFDFIDLTEVFEDLQEAISLIGQYLSKLNLSILEKRRIRSWIKELPSHPVELYFKYYALQDAADFIFRLLDEKESGSLREISSEFARMVNEEDKEKLEETARMLVTIRDKRDSAASFDESLQHTLAFREAVKIVGDRDRIAKVIESNIRNISRSGGGKSIYLGKEELKWIRLGEKALVKVVEYQPFRSRIEIYPM